MVIQEGCDIMATNEIMQNERKKILTMMKELFLQSHIEESGYV